MSRHWGQSRCGEIMKQREAQARANQTNASVVQQHPAWRAPSKRPAPQPSVPRTISCQPPAKKPAPVRTESGTGLSAAAGPGTDRLVVAAAAVVARRSSRVGPPTRLPEPPCSTPVALSSGVSELGRSSASRVQLPAPDPNNDDDDDDHCQNPFDDDDEEPSRAAPPTAAAAAVSQLQETAPLHPQGESHVAQVYPVDHTMYKKILHPEVLLQVRMADLLNHANCPLYLQDEIMKIIQDTARRGFNFATEQIRQRPAVMRHLQKDFPVPTPIIHNVYLQGSSKKNIRFELGPHDQKQLLTYDFHEQMHDLYQDRQLWGDTSNLVNQMLHPGMYEGRPLRPRLVDEVVDGDWYARTCHQIRNSGLVRDGEHFLVSPIIGYVDAAGTDHAYQRHGAEPFLITSALLSRKARNKFTAWRLLGYLPKFGGSSAQKKRLKSGGAGRVGVPTRNRHKCLACMFHSLIKGQGLDRSVVHHVRCGETVHTIRVFHPLAFVATDGQERDHQCGRKGSYNNAGRISSACHTCQRNCDKTSHECFWASQDYFHRISRTTLRLQDRLDELVALYVEATPGRKRHGRAKTIKQELADEKRDTRNLLKQLHQLLKDLTQHCHISGYHGVWFGSNPHGIHGATPTDLMHAFLHGVVPYLVKIVMGSLTDDEKTQLDNLVQRIMQRIRSSERMNFPRAFYSDGISNLTLVTSDEWAGIVFCLSLVISTREGHKLFEGACERVRNSAQQPDWQYDGSSEEEDEPTPNERLQGIALDESSSVEGFADSDSCSGASWDDEDDSQQCDRAKKPAAKDDGRHDAEVSSSSDEEESSNGEESSVDGEVDNDNDPKGDKIPRIAISADDLLALLHRCLAFQAWYAKGHPFRISTDDDVRRIKRHLHSFIRGIKKHVPRHEKNNWKLQKLHEILHLPDQMKQFGSPMNCEVGVMENNLQAAVTRPGQRALKREKDFTVSLNNRVCENNRLARAMQHVPDDIPETRRQIDRREYWKRKTLADTSPRDYSEVRNDDDHADETDSDNSDDSQDADNRNGDQPVASEFRAKNPHYTIHLPTQSVRFPRKNQRYHVNQVVVDHLCRHYAGKVETIDCFYEYWRAEKRYRAHPNFQGKGEWYEWVTMSWTNDDGSPLAPQPFDMPLGHSNVPEKVLCFFRDPMTNSEPPDQAGILMLTHSCVRPVAVPKGGLLQRWDLDYVQTENPARFNPQLYIQSVDCIDRRVLVVQDRPGITDSLHIGGPDSCTVPTNQSVRAALLRRQTEEFCGVSVVLPREEFWPPLFALSRPSNAEEDDCSSKESVHSDDDRSISSSSNEDDGSNDDQHGPDDDDNSNSTGRDGSSSSTDDDEEPGSSAESNSSSEGRSSRDDGVDRELCIDMAQMIKRQRRVLATPQDHQR